MLKRNDAKQYKMELVILDNLVPENHLLRKIDKVIDFSFINKICEPYYCLDNGRPAIEPECLFRMLFIGYLYGIRSERRLVEEVKVNVAYRWFIGYDLEDKIPDASVIWQNRIRRFNGTDIPQQIFDNIVRQAMSYGLVGGKVLYSDSTHLKANANKYTEAEVIKERQDYIDALNEAINEDRLQHGKKPLKFDGDETKETSEEEKEDYFDDKSGKGGTGGVGDAKNVKMSTTDPDSGFMHRDGKPQGFFYLDHRCVTTDRNGYRQYKCKNDRCVNCPRREECLSAKQITKSLTRHIWEDFKDEAYEFTHTEKGKHIYQRRKETIERSFADSKELHGLRYCRMRGLEKVMEQCLLTAAAQNMKKNAMSVA